MKRLLKSALLIALFVASFSSEAFSQTITNNTDCYFMVEVGYSSASICDDLGTEEFYVAPNSTTTVSYKITSAKGNVRIVPSGSLGTLPTCGTFQVSVAPCVNNPTDTQFCTAGACTTFTATIDPSDGTLTIN